MYNGLLVLPLLPNSLQATQEDNPDRFSITTLTVSRQRGPGQGWSRGAGQLSFSRAQYSSRVLESEPLHRCGVVYSNKVLTLPLCSSVLTLVTSWPPSSPGLQLSFTISPGDLPGEEFSVR